MGLASNLISAFAYSAFLVAAVLIVAALGSDLGSVLKHAHKLLTGE